MKKISIISFLLLLICNWQPAWGEVSDDDEDNDSRTEEAKDRLSGESGPLAFRTARLIFNIGMEFMPHFFYFQEIKEDEPPLRYNNYPYQSSDYTGLRNFENGSRSLWDIEGTVSMPQGKEAMQQASANIKRNFYYWSMIGGYEYLKEQGAPYPIHQYEFLIERKFRFIPQGDGGLQVGGRGLHIDGGNYVGPSVGINMEVYPFKPVSVSYRGNITLTTFTQFTNHELNFNVHRNSTRFFFRYRWLDIGGVNFETFSLGTGFYF